MPRLTLYDGPILGCPSSPDRSHKRVARAVGSIGLALRLTFAPFASLRFNKPVLPEQFTTFADRQTNGQEVDSLTRRGELA